MTHLRFNRLKRQFIKTSPFQAEVLFVRGLFGFEKYTRYFLKEHQQESPFLRLESIENRELFFYVTDPFLECPNYTPSFLQKDLQEVGVNYEAKLILLAIVYTKSRPFTLNLAAPLLIHWSKRIGKQILIDNNPEFPLGCYENTNLV